MDGPIGLALSSLTGLAPSRLAELAVQAERRGFDTIAVTESYSDIMPLAAAVARATRSATVATAIANTGFRHPALMAMGASAVDELSGGRFVLGLGVGTQWFDRAAVSEVARRPLAALAEYVEVMRRLWDAGPRTVRMDGSFYRLDDFHLDRHPRRPRIPVYLAALGPGMLRLAGRIADGVFLNLAPPDTLPGMIARVREAAVSAGRAPGAVAIAALARTCLDDDLDRARDGARASLPLYVGFPAYARYLRALGYGAVVDAVHAALARDDQAAAIAAIPDELVDRLTVYGPPDRCRAGVERLRAAGVDLPIVSARPADGDWDGALPRAIDAFAPDSSEAARLPATAPDAVVPEEAS
jgi:5,10-methylenetetrahydromethanopterin reductase